MALFAGSGGVRAEFVESRTLSILLEPIETRGRLLFSPPDRMVRETFGPAPTRLVIHAQSIEWENEAGRQRIAFARDDVAASLTGDLMVLLRGDLAELVRRHEVVYEAEGSSWSLTLTPRNDRVRSIIDIVRASGTGERLDELTMIESNGDSTETRFGDVETGLSWTDDEIEVVFGFSANAGTP